MSIETMAVADDAASTQEAAPAPPARDAAARAGWAAGWASLLLLAVWMGQLTPGWLPAAATCALAWAVLARTVAWPWRAATLAALAVTVGLAAHTQRQLWSVAHDWLRVRAAVDSTAGERVNEGLDQLFDRGGRAVLGAADLAGGATRPSAGLFAEMSRIRHETGMTALAIYRPDGSPLVWAGEHRGAVPDSVKGGMVESSFSAGPLFGYIYFSERLQTGNVAVAAKLLQAHVKIGEGVQPYAERFAERNGIVPLFTTPELAQGDRIWDWATDSVTILSGVFETLTQQGWRDRVIQRGREDVTRALAIAALLMAIAWYRRPSRDPALPVAVFTAGLLLLPLADVSAAAGLFSPVRFVLPLPADVTLGQLLVVLCGGSIWMLARQKAGRVLGRVPLAVRVALAAAVLVTAFWMVRHSVAASVLAEREGGGAPLIVGFALGLALPLYLLFGRRGDGPVRTQMVAAALAVSAALGLLLAAWWGPGRHVPVWAAAAWAVPFALAAAGVPRSESRRGALLPWACVAWMAATLALPTLWTMHVDERLRDSERELVKLGTQADPFLDYLLRQFAEEVLRLDAEGRRGVSLLYQAWVEAGLAREGYEARITHWNGGRAGSELRLADATLPPERVAALLELARREEEPKLERLTSVPGLHYLLVVPLAGGQSVTVAVPPRAYLGRSHSLARFLDPEDSDATDAAATLSLVPAPPGAAEAGGAVRWVRAENGWRSEATVAFPGARMHAHLLVPTPTRLILFARGVVSLALVLGALAGLWALGRTLCGEPLGVEPARWGWIFTFRGRLTGALFIFFLLPMAAFGATAYRALSREVERTAAAIADRALTQAASEARGQSLSALARHVDADLLLYERGVLRQAAAPEVIDLGLYHAWLPASVYLDFAQSEATERVENRQLAGHEYLVAYRRLAGGQVLASPTPLATGEIARRRRELADLVALAGLAGAVLSIVLSLFVARAFSRPIEALSGAAESVGAGNLSVRLPSGRRDEFGRVYSAFNRMVRGLRQTQAALVQETRRTEAIVAEAGTGVVALDGAGRVALINPRAEQILGGEVPVGARIPEDRPLPAAVAATVRDFLASGARERVDEREVDGRVVRLRMRGLSVDKARRGAVLVLEDVTNEIRSARVLAWGEMARQVAHEIKNPLTPIKLAVQHVRRAWADGRDDFGTILDRNVEAVLREIDHLGEISRAFARFGTPAEAAAPVERVDVRRVAEETLALYHGGHDGIRYELDVPADAPRVSARPGELKEVLVNLLENARGALDGDGEVRISAALSGGGEWLRVDVADTGEGIPPESLPRVFEPQFSTRTSGTGLGLAIVKRLVEAWGGEVTVDSTPGEGTTVHLRLRVAEPVES
ncbi:ATP-binding protein [Longimicrobium sp.]|uniref:ATP-binding protein n=1 Tax=Longimicrobium sp. TaxID=2029185 RepID=UPI002F947D70